MARCCCSNGCLASWSLRWRLCSSKRSPDSRFWLPSWQCCPLASTESASASPRLGHRCNPQYGDARLRPEEVIAPGTTHNQHGQAHIEHGPAHLANTALQIIRKACLHHHGKPKIHLAFGDGDAPARMDARACGMPLNPSICPLGFLPFLRLEGSPMENLDSRTVWRCCLDRKIDTPLAFRPHPDMPQEWWA